MESDYKEVPLKLNDKVHSMFGFLKALVLVIGLVYIGDYLIDHASASIKHYNKSLAKADQLV